MKLADQDCQNCRVAVAPLQGAALAALAVEVLNWRVVDGHHLAREFAFGDFGQALAFCNVIGALAEAQGHHPDLHLGWGRLGVVVWTHSIGGLAEGDFVLAAKIDRLWEERG